MSDDELLECVRHVVQSRCSISGVAMLAAESGARPLNAKEVRHHVLSASAAMSAAVANANCWSLFKDTYDMWGT